MRAGRSRSQYSHTPPAARRHGDGRDSTSSRENASGGFRKPEICPDRTAAACSGHKYTAERQCTDIGQQLGHDRLVTGRIEDAIRAAVTPGDVLATPPARGHLTSGHRTPTRLSCRRARRKRGRPLPRRALEEIPDFLHGRDWVLIGSVYSTDSAQGSLDEHLKRYLKRATAGWVAAVLEKAAVITIDRSRPAHIRPRPGW
jgi:hypothetical protein